MISLFRNKKGVSPVVSAVIMMLVVMIGMSALFAFFVNYSRDFQMGSGSSVFESMTVEDVWFKNKDSVEIWVYNYGKIDLTITNIFVDKNAVSFTFLSPSENLTVAVGGHCKIVVLSSTTRDFMENESYTFKIVTSRGTSFEGVYTW